jgi:hypothetical protein
MATRASDSKDETNDTPADELAESVDRLTAELRVIRDVLDDLRTELQYVVRNPGENRVVESMERLRMTSLPLDPTVEDFKQRVNAVPEATVAELRMAAETTQEKKQRSATNQRGLF